jgi:hypothetical protein
MWGFKSTSLHMNIKKFMTICLCSLAATNLQAQSTIVKSIPIEEAQGGLHQKPKALSKELSAGYKKYTNGYGFFVEYGKISNIDYRSPNAYYNTKFWSLEFREIKDPREIKTQALIYNDQANSKFTFGKINNSYALKLGYGVKKMIGGKPEVGHVSVHYVLNGGLAASILKPYYLWAQFGGKPSEIMYSEETENEFLNNSYIFGRSTVMKGLKDSEIGVGAHVRAGIQFDIASSNKSIIGIETGVNLEAYSHKLQIMALKEGKPYVANLYISVQFGSRF